MDNIDIIKLIKTACAETRDLLQEQGHADDAHAFFEFGENLDMAEFKAKRDIVRIGSDDEIDDGELIALEDTIKFLDDQMGKSHGGYYHSKGGWVGMALKELHRKLRQQQIDKKRS